MKAKKLTKQLITEWGLRHDWTIDSHGNLHKIIGGKDYRIKFQPTSIRREVKVNYPGDAYSKPSSEWIRLSGGYYKDISINAEDKLVRLAK